MKILFLLVTLFILTTTLLKLLEYNILNFILKMKMAIRIGLQIMMMTV